MSVKVEGIEEVYRGFCTLSRVMLSDGEQRFRREVEDHGQAVAVLPYDPERRVALLVQLPRAPVMLAGAADHLIEAPAGLIDDGESPEDCARREAHEEAGVELADLEPAGSSWSTPGISTERITMFLAPYHAAARTGAGGGLVDEHENITVVELPLADLARRADAGNLGDLKTFCLVQTLRLRHPDLFRA